MRWSRFIGSTLVKHFPILQVESKSLTWEDISKIWSAISSLIERHLDKKKGIRLPGLGTFAYVTKRINLGLNILQSDQHPVFILEDKIALAYGLKRPNIYVEEEVPIKQLDLAILANLLACDDPRLKHCYTSVLKNVEYSLKYNKPFELPFPGVGKLKYARNNYKFIFNADFMNTHRIIDTQSMTHSDVCSEDVPMHDVECECICEHEMQNNDTRNKTPSKITRSVKQAKIINKALGVQPYGDTADDIILENVCNDIIENPIGESDECSVYENYMEKQKPCPPVLKPPCIINCDQESMNALQPKVRQNVKSAFYKKRIKAGEDMNNLSNQPPSRKENHPVYTPNHLEESCFGNPEDWICEECSAKCYLDYVRRANNRLRDKTMMDDIAYRNYMELQNAEENMNNMLKAQRKRHALRRDSLYNRDHAECLKNKARLKKQAADDSHNQYLFWNRPLTPWQTIAETNRQYGRDLGHQRKCKDRQMKMDKDKQFQEDVCQRDYFMNSYADDLERERQMRLQDYSDMRRALNLQISQKRPWTEPGGAFVMPYEQREKYLQWVKRRGDKERNENWETYQRKKRELEDERREEIECEAENLEKLKDLGKDTGWKYWKKRARLNETVQNACQAMKDKYERDMYEKYYWERHAPSVFKPSKKRQCQSCCRMFDLEKKEHEIWRMEERWPQREMHYALASN